MRSSTIRPYRGPHGLNERNDRRLTDLQLSPGRKVLRGQVYKLAHAAAVGAKARSGGTVTAHFNQAVSEMIDMLEAA